MKNFVSVDSKTSLAEEWKRTRENELRRELKGNTANPSEDGKSLYERLQEQRREKAQKEMDESRDGIIEPWEIEPVLIML